MKKRALLIVSMMIILTCLFVIYVGANEVNTDYNEQYVKTMTQGMLSVELEDGTSVNLYDEQGYTLCYYWDDVASASRKLMSVRTKDLTFNFNGTRLSSIYYGEEYLAGNAHTGKIVVVNLRGIKNSSGQDITDFNGDNMFKENSPLQHIFMPDTIEYLTGYAFGFRNRSLSHLRGCYFSENSKLKEIKFSTFTNCEQLRGFYMPKGVTQIGSNGFQGCFNAFFVNDPYDFLTKPDVYYFPEGLYKTEDETFDSLKYNLNKVLVFSADNIEINNAWAFELVACDTNGTKPTIVFKGNVSSINIGSWNVGAIYFCHENDLDATSAGVSGSKTMHFCNAEGNTTHLAEKTVYEEAKCEVDAGNYTYCFCGKVISKEAVEGTALSHDYDYINGKGSLISLNYDDISKDGTKTVKCGLCGKEDNTIFAKRLFDYIGYSSNDKGGMCMGYDINLAEVKEYETMYGKLNYGFVASANNDTPLDENGNEETNTVKVNLNENKYTRVDFVLSSDNWEDEKVASAKITLNMYVIVNNAVKYITANGLNDTAESYKYSEI